MKFQQSKAFGVSLKRYVELKDHSIFQVEKNIQKLKYIDELLKSSPKTLDYSK